MLVKIFGILSNDGSFGRFCRMFEDAVTMAGIVVAAVAGVCAVIERRHSKSRMIFKEGPPMFASRPVGARKKNKAEISYAKRGRANLKIGAPEK